MKTTLLISAGLACVLLATQALAATNVSTDWYTELNTVQQDSNQTTGGRIRADAVLSAVLLATRDGLTDHGPSHPAESPPAGANLEAAAAEAAHAAMTVLYPQSQPVLDAQLAKSLAGIADNDAAIASGRKWGAHVADVILADQSDVVLLNPRTFAATAAPVETSSLPDAHAEAHPPIAPGRYRFSVLAGTPGTKGYVDGVGPAARFDNPNSIAVDASGTAYVSERDLGVIRKISPDGTVSTLAGLAGQKGSQDGMGATARFNEPADLGVDGAGNVYVADAGNHAIRKIDPAGNVTTHAGKAGEPGHIDGNKANVRLNMPAYLAVDEAGNVFVSESGVVRKILPDGSASTLAVDLPYDRAAYSGVWPFNLCIDRTGYLYAIYSDAWDFIDAVKLTPTDSGRYTGRVLAPEPPRHAAMGLGIDGLNNLYVAYDLNPVYRFSPDGAVEVRYGAGSAAGESRAAMAVDASGRIFSLPYSFSANGGIIQVAVFDPLATDPVILWPPSNQASSRGGSARFAVDAVGGAPLTYQWYFNANPIAGATGATLSLPNVQDDLVGFYSVSVSDGTSSVTSGKVTLAILQPKEPATPPVSPAPPLVSPNPGSGTSGGGSFDGGVALAFLGLLAAAARRRKMLAGVRVRTPGAADDIAIATGRARAMETGT